MSFAFGEPPDSGAKKARTEGIAWLKAGGFYSRSGGTRLMTFATSLSRPRETRRTLLHEGHRALHEVGAAGHLLLDPGLELELLGHARVEPVVQLVLRSRILARGS